MKIADQAQIIGVCTMNNIPNVKIGLRDSLRSIDRQLADSKKQKNNTEIRVLIDKRRHALAQLEDEISRPSSHVPTTTSTQTHKPNSSLKLGVPASNKLRQILCLSKMMNFVIYSLIMFFPRNGILTMIQLLLYRRRQSSS